jgi:hypothetical protein
MVEDLSGPIVWWSDVEPLIKMSAEPSDKFVKDIADQISISLGKMTIYNISQTIDTIHGLCHKLRTYPFKG